jgi:predicted O-methyltransferase YrrM
MSLTLVPDPLRAGGWTLLLDGVEQSYVDTNDPTYLKFDYTRRFASVLDCVAPAGKPVRVLHLGGGALTMARYVARTRPGSPQTVVDQNAGLLRMVRRQLPLPTGAPIEVAIGDARDTVRGRPAGTYDVVLADVYVGAQKPASVSSVEFVRDAARLLAPGGVFATNLADLPPLAFTRVQAATLRAVFGDVCAIGELGMLRGRRYGNTVLVATGARVKGGVEVGRGLPVVRLARAADRDRARGRVLHGADLDAFIGGAAPATDASLAHSA